MVVASPVPTIPSVQRMRTKTAVCRIIVAIDRTCGRMVGKSTRKVSMDSIANISHPSVTSSFVATNMRLASAAVKD